MKKIANLYYKIICFIIGVIPAPVLAEIHTVYDAKEKAKEVVDSIKNSPIYELLFYVICTLGFFVGIVVVIVFLLMLLKK